MIQAEARRHRWQGRAWRWPMWASPGVLAVAWGAVVVWGSLLPMRFDGPGFVAEHGGVWEAVVAALSTPALRGGWDRTDFSDVLTNVVLYVPLGLLLRMALRGRRRPGEGGAAAGLDDSRGAWEPGWVWHAGVAAGVVAGMSWLLESTQALAPGRVGAMSDWLLNAGPGALAAVVGPAAVDGARRLAFFGYTRSAGVWHVLKGQLRLWQMRPVRLETVSIVAALAAVLGAYAWVADNGLPGQGALACLRFVRHGAIAFLEGGRRAAATVLVYAVAAACLGLPLLGRGLRRKMGRVIVGVLALAALVEVVGLVSHGSLPDVTEGCLALMGVMVGGIAYAAGVAAVRWSCRRRGAAADYSGPERRRFAGA
ncbi:MAG: VanZ family protein [Planctomycetota bacterium]